MGWSRFEIVSAATQAAAHSVYLPNPSLALHNFPPSPKSAVINYEQFLPPPGPHASLILCLEGKNKLSGS